MLHDYGLLWIYSAQATASVSFEAARVLDLPFSTTVVAPAQLDGDGIIDLVGARTGSEPFSFLNNHSSPQLYEFERIDATIADVESRRLAAFGTPTAVKFVELDGVPPLEIIVTSSGPFGNVANAGVRVLFGQ